VTPDAEVLAGIRALLRPVVQQLVEEFLAERAATEPTARQLLSTAVAAEELGVTPDTVVTWIGKGWLRATKLPGGRDWRIRREDLDEALESMGSKPVAVAPPAVDVAARGRELAAAVTKRKGSR
jgi:excisionase family DNA binding protein